MTDRERLVRTMRFQPVDRPPFWGDGPWPQTLERWKTEGVPDGDVEAAVGVRFLRTKSYPVDTFLIPPFEPRILRQEGDFVIRTDCFGATIKDCGDHMTMPMWLDHAVKTPEDLRALIPRLDSNLPGREPADWPEKRLAWLADDEQVGSAIGGFYYGILRNLMGVERISLMMYDAPDAVDAFLEAYNNLVLAVLKRALDEVPVDWLQFGEDFAYKTSSLLSPAQFRRFLLPGYRKVTEYARSRGVDLFILDSDGNINGLLDDLLESGVNVVFPLECAAGMDPVRIREKYGRRMRMVGGIDKRVLTRGKQAIRDEVYRKVPGLVAEGGYIPHIDHSIPSDVPFKNYRYFISCLKEVYGI